MRTTDRHGVSPVATTRGAARIERIVRHALTAERHCAWALPLLRFMHGIALHESLFATPELRPVHARIRRPTDGPGFFQQYL